MHTDPEVIAADLAFSERLGAELLADPTPGEPSTPVVRQWTSQVRRVNLVAGTETIETITEAV